MLMVADITIYDAEVVPVGKDQLQHLEMTRDVAGRFNHQMGETFVLLEKIQTMHNISLEPMVKKCRNLKIILSTFFYLINTT